MLRSMVQDAHVALVDLRSRNAEQAFSQTLALLETSTPKVIQTLITGTPVPKRFTLLHNLRLMRAASDNYLCAELFCIAE